ncbi:MAG TPA: bifunctional phosphoribosyl-AMP cyclohydrolase/phosphoribosyl-ATP diphosphatase HisIE [Candidatus Limnocylindrales bacterium]
MTTSVEPGVVAVPAIRYGPDGLVPAVVQDVADGRVLMLGYTDAEALAATLATGEVHFHSRSRGRLWRKGETSGHVLLLRDLTVDCDADALLFRVEPVGTTCHRGTRSCFDAPPTAGELAPGPDDGRSTPAGRLAASQGFAWLETLWTTIEARRGADPATSYTARLLDGGVDAAGRKVTEEATEVLLAAKDDAAATAAGDEPGDDRRQRTSEALAAETADLLYHVLVLLAERDVPPARVIETLRARHAP